MFFFFCEVGLKLVNSCSVKKVKNVKSLQKGGQNLNFQRSGEPITKRNVTWKFTFMSFCYFYESLIYIKHQFCLVINGYQIVKNVLL